MFVILYSCRYFISLISFQFGSFPPLLAVDNLCEVVHLNILKNG